jgi:hypothetical protein
MKILLFVVTLVVCPFSLLATDHWQFVERVAVSTQADAVFHHLDGAGRKHIAVSDGRVAVVWEDNSTSDPQTYLSFKSHAEKSFSPPIQLSRGQEAYEPSIATLANGRFVMAWEQDSSVYISALERSDNVISKPLKLSSAKAGHVSLSSLDNEVFAVWREYDHGKWSLWIARLEFTKGEFDVLSRNRVEASPVGTPMLFPSVSASPAGLNVAWEDRRSGHTRLLYSYSRDRGLTFSAPEYLNEFQSGRNVYDKGSGVTRVSLHPFGQDEVLAAWMDKRRSNTGYGIYAALASDGGESYGPNERVHGEPGDKQPHYNPATAGNRKGEFVVAWDDFRSGNSDIWLSSLDANGEWSKDFSPPVATGNLEQSHASVAMDADGNLYLLWIEREDSTSATTLWYSFGRAGE